MDVKDEKREEKNKLTWTYRDYEDVMSSGRGRRNEEKLQEETRKMNTTNNHSEEQMNLSNRETEIEVKGVIFAFGV